MEARMRAYNFSAGPATIAEEVLAEARDELIEWHGVGASVMEISHRGQDFMGLAREIQQDFRDLLAIPDHYQVLFLQGGAQAQFAFVPMNLKRPAQSADYILTGTWGEKAWQQAASLGEVRVAASSKEDGYRHIPALDTWNLDPRSAYVHYTPNETISGVEFFSDPDVGDVPLVADMSSNILSRPMDISRFDLIYAGAQKNMGPSGLTVVIIREDLLQRCPDAMPWVFNYRMQAEQQSMYNTPNTFAWYLAGKVFKWLKAKGGLEAIEAHNVKKATLLYEAIDASDFYRNPVERSCRSRMNVPFTLARPELDELFLEKSAANGLLALKGHKLVGGMRASIYNAMPIQGVEALVQFMQDFEKDHA